METKPILFSGDMVRAILSGDKTMTRRIIKPQPKCRLCYITAGCSHGKWEYPDEDTAEFWGEKYRLPEGMTDADMKKLWTPPCHGDDILWVRETWNDTSDGAEKGHYCYRADFRSDYIHPCDVSVGGYPMSCRGQDCDFCEPFRMDWRPSIHMPKEAARLFLRVTGVSVERVQDMTEDDAYSEGFNGIPLCHHLVFENYPDTPIPCEASDGSECPPNYPYDKSIPELFGEMVWDELLKPADREKYGWEANPWVWVITFEKCERPEGF